MSSDSSAASPISNLPRNRNWFLSWEFALLKICLLAIIAVMLDQPVGSIGGQIALEEKGFQQFNYNLRSNKVYAMVYGPRGKNELERGVWVNNDGTFRVDQLPVGEYSLRLRAPGFGSENRYGILVQEGKEAKPKDTIKLSLLDPYVNIASNSRVFTTKEAPHFWVNGTGTSEAEVKLYKQDFLEFIKTNDAEKSSVEVASDFGFYIQNPGNFKDPFAAQGRTPVATFSRKLNQDESDNSHAEFIGAKPLPAGDYFAVVKAKDLFGKAEAVSMTWFSVSDLGLVIKQAPNKTIVRAIDLNTLKGIPGVELTLGEKDSFKKAGKLLTGKTSENGLGTINLPPELAKKNSTELNVIGRIGANRAYSGYSVWHNDSESHRSYFYTDRPVYRLGQTVYFKGISRRVGESGLFNNGAAEKLQVTVEDPDNNELKTYHLATNKHGSFHGLIDIPQDGKTGAYQVTIKYPDGYISYQGFEVAQYRKPEYQVEVLPISDRVIAGQKGKVRIHASYFFGGPVANARVKYNVYSSTDWSNRYKLMDRPSYFGFFDSWHTDDDYYEGSGDLVQEGYAVTDDNGEAIVEFATPAATNTDLIAGPPGNSYQDKKLKIEAEVTDLSRQSATGSGFLPMTNGNFFLSVTPTNYVVRVGEELSCDVQAIDYTGNAVSNKKVSLKMIRYPWDSFKYEFRPGIEVATLDGNTDSKGKVHFNVKTKDQWNSDSYELIATSNDDSGNLVLDNNSIWVASDARPFFFSPTEAQKEPLQVRLDKKVYRAGDTARVILSGPFTGKEGMEAIVSVEGTKIHDLKIVPLTSAAQLVEIPIKREYIPNFYVTATVVTKKKQFFNQEEMVMVSPEDNFLKIAVETDKERYKPGDTAQYKIKVTKQDGSPAKDVELSLGLVDESIYSIRAEVAENINKFFFSQIANAINTINSFPEQYSGGPDKLEPRVRKDFRDTAAWLPELVTNSEGVATASIHLPDNLTTWRATIRGTSLDTNFGQTVSKVLSTQDLIARLALPRFYRSGDQGNVTAIVHNFTNKPQEVKLALQLSKQLSTTLGLAQTITIAPDKATRMVWPVKAEFVGNAQVSLKAIGQTAADALSRNIDIIPMGVETSAVVAGVVREDNKQIDLPLGSLADAIPGTVKRTLSLASSSIGPVMGNYQALIDYPYGCTEQTMSRLIPATVAVQLNQQLGAKLDKKDQERFAKVYKLAMEKLTSYQHGDGGWGWWLNDQSNLYMTSLVLDGLKGLSQAGYAVPENMLKQALAWQTKAIPELARQLGDPKHVVDAWQDYSSMSDLAYGLYTQALYQKPLTPELKAAQSYVLQHRETLPPEGLSYLTRALQLRGDKNQARTCLNRLLAIANNSASTIDWDYTPKLKKAIGIDDDYFCYRFTPEETTALALTALLEVKPQASADIEKIKAYLMLQRGKDGWTTTKATGTIFKALLKEELASGKTSQNNPLAGNPADAGNPEKDVASGATPASSGANDGNSDNFVVNFLKESLALFTNSTGPSNENLPAASLRFTALDRIAKEKLYELSTEVTNLQNRAALPNQLSFAKEGPGRLYYNLTTSYFQDLSKLSLEEANLRLKSYPEGLVVKREFLRLKSVANTSDGTIHLKSEPIGAIPIKSGETILMKTTVTSNRALPYVIVEAALPSGAEVVQSENQENAVDDNNNDGNTIQGDWQPAWWNHQDILDDKIVFFGTHLRPGTCEFTSLLRMESPGSVRVNPVTVSTMYSKAVKAFSKVDSINVVP